MGGGLAGHNGLKSLKAGFGSPDFARVRIGVGRPDTTDPEIVSAYVLGRGASPTPRSRDLVDRAADAVERIVDGRASRVAAPRWFRSASLGPRSIVVLGALSAFGPLSIDMYLPALPAMADDLARRAVARAADAHGVPARPRGRPAARRADQRRARPPRAAAGRPASSTWSRRPAARWRRRWACSSRSASCRASAGASGIVIGRAIVRDLASGVARRAASRLLILVNGVAPILAPVIGGGPARDDVARRLRRPGRDRRPAARGDRHAAARDARARAAAPAACATRCAPSAGCWPTGASSAAWSPPGWPSRRCSPTSRARRSCCKRSTARRRRCSASSSAPTAWDRPRGPADRPPAARGHEPAPLMRAGLFGVAGGGAALLASVLPASACPASCRRCSSRWRRSASSSPTRPRSRSAATATRGRGVRRCSAWRSSRSARPPHRWSASAGEHTAVPMAIVVAALGAGALGVFAALVREP